MGEIIEEIERDSSLDYTKILKALMELPFQVGKNLLIDFLVGNYKNKSVVKNCLDELPTFGELNWDKGKISQEIDRLIANGMIDLGVSDYNRYVKVLKLTIRGRNEIIHPTLEAKKLKNKVEFKKTEITEADREKFEALESFLGGFNDEQKKAIISEAEKILCVAGAGSGKTTVLTKRIEFLVKYRSIPADKILAVTFTRKAREEMKKRLHELGIDGVRVNTFNSFCESILRKHGDRIYGRPIRVQGYADKILAMNMALGNLGIDMEDAIQRYFTPQQRRFKTGNQMANSFMNDCFSVMDYFKVTSAARGIPSQKGTGVPSLSGKDEYDFSKDADGKNKHNAKMIHSLTQQLKDHMMTQGLRDFTDQVIDAIKFLKDSPEDTPQFDHILVDEYQDVNAMQIELLGLLKPRNFFAVGDPRQSIFGWRGSDINYIIDFEKGHSNPEVIHLTKNYRSAKEIVGFMNKSIVDMGLPDLEYANARTLAASGIPSALGTSSEVPSLSGKIKIMDFKSEEDERKFVVRKIMDSDVPRDEIFVLARTNRQLMELSKIMKQKGINHVVKTDEVRNPKTAHLGDVTLATIHAIKGLEAKLVFVIGSNEQNFPCKASDHPAIEMIKTDNYDREEEERRLFYVAISRAKEVLYITYSGKKPTYFITSEMRGMLE